MTSNPLEWVSFTRAENLYPLSRTRLRELIASGELRSIESGKNRRKVNVRDLERLSGSTTPTPASTQAA